jgi:hypothetical protein
MIGSTSSKTSVGVSSDAQRASSILACLLWISGEVQSYLRNFEDEEEELA